MNRNAGLNGYPQRDMMILTDNWVLFEDESLADQIQASMEEFIEKVKGTSFYQPRRLWQSTNPLSALEADLVHDGPELYYPSSHQYEKLKKLKARVDPNEIFSSPVSIPVSHRDSAKSDNSKI